MRSLPIKSFANAISRFDGSVTLLPGYVKYDCNQSKEQGI